MKLSETQQKCLEAIKRNGYISVTFWGGSVFSMSVKGNINTLNALVKKGLVKKSYKERNVIYSLTTSGD